MAGPKLAEGFTRIADGILEDLMRYPWGSGAELRLVLCVLRLTYGYQRREAPIGRRRFEKMTGLHHRTVDRVLARLVEAGILSRTARRGVTGASRASVWAYVKDSTRWSWPTGPSAEDAVSQAPRARNWRTRHPGESQGDPGDSPGDVPTESPGARPVDPPGLDGSLPPRPAMEADPITAAAMADGFTGPALLAEVRRRRRSTGNNPADGDGAADGASDERPDSGTGASDERSDRETGASPPEAMPRSSCHPTAPVALSPLRERPLQTPPYPPQRENGAAEATTEPAPDRAGALKETSPERDEGQGEPAPGAAPTLREQAEAIQRSAEQAHAQRRQLGAAPARHPVDALPEHLQPPTDRGPKR